MSRLLAALCLILCTPVFICLADEGHGTWNLPPQAFIGLDKIGVELLSEPVPLFHPSEANDWNQDIAFEEVNQSDSTPSNRTMDPL